MASKLRQLSVREAKFAAAVASGLTGVDAAIQAGYSSNRRTASVTATRLAKRPQVRDRIAALTEADPEKTARDDHIAKLIELRDRALSKGHSAAAIRAQELLAKAHGVLGEEASQSTMSTIHSSLDAASTDDIRAALLAAVEKFAEPSPPEPTIDPPAPSDPPRPVAGSDAVH